LIHLVSANGDLMVAAATRCGKTATFALPLIRRVQDGGNGRTCVFLFSSTRESAA
jgi:superfamily II DNA/RNA helicase